jgi:hypothetical protein
MRKHLQALKPFFFYLLAPILFAAYRPQNQASFRFPVRPIKKLKKPIELMDNPCDIFSTFAAQSLFFEDLAAFTDKLDRFWKK